MLKKTNQLTHEQFIEAVGDSKPVDETHDAASSVLYWNVAGRWFIEQNYDVGPVEWLECEEKLLKT